jgi:hypothetical protein
LSDSSVVSDKNDTTDEVDTVDEIEKNDTSVAVKSNDLPESEQKRKIKFSELFESFKGSQPTIPTIKGKHVKKVNVAKIEKNDDENDGENPFIMQNNQEDSEEDDKLKNDYQFLLEQLENIVKKFGILREGEYYIHRSDVRELAEPIWVKLTDIKPRFKNVLEEEFQKNDFRFIHTQRNG